MDKKLLLQTKIILEELQISGADYLQLLSAKEKIEFIGDWRKLSESASTRLTDDILKTINELIYKFQELRNQFWKDGGAEKDQSLRFDPNSVPAESQDSSSIEIRNEVISAVRLIAGQFTLANESNKS